MFPIRSGIGNLSAPDRDQVFFQSIAASAMHEIGKRAIQDTSLLMFHQIAAEIYYRQDEGVTIPVDANDQYIVYTPEQEKEVRKHLIDIVMKFHILDENGLGNKLTPIIDSLHNRTPIPSHLATDPFLCAVLDGHRKFTQDIYNESIQQVMAKILNFDAVVNRRPQENDANILASYVESDNMVNVAIYDDDTIQCVCSFCEGFFQILEKENNIALHTLNLLQQTMVEKYALLRRN